MEFLFAKITDSRLMGSMGLRICWNKKGKVFNQFFLLDAEGLGVSDYVSLTCDDEYVLQREEDRLMGGLGSNRIYISKDEAVFLVKFYSDKNKEYEKDLPENFNECDFMLDMDSKNVKFESLFLKLCKTIESSIEFVNYMTMRFIAKDTEALYFFSKNKEISKMHLTQINGVLLKNEIKKVTDNLYISNCLYEDEDGHYISKLGLNIDFENKKLNSIVISNVKEVDIFDVMDMTKKREYLGVYKVNNLNEFMYEFDRENSNFMKTYFEKGVMFTHFNDNNNHVNEFTYFISNDIHCIYYIMKNNQLVISNYSEQDRISVDDIMRKKYKDYIVREHEFIFESSIIYKFAEQGHDDFYKFINYEE